MRAVWLLPLAALVACGGDSGDKDSGSPPADSGHSTTTTTTTTNTGGTTNTVETTATLTGTVTGPSGALEGLSVKMCRGDQCRYATTTATGGYEFTEAAVSWHSLEIVPPEGLATAFAPIQLGSQEVRDISFYLPALDAAHPLGAPAEVELGDGLLVTVGAGELEPPLFIEDATEVAGVLVDPANYPPIDQAGTVVALWYTSPFDHHAIDAAGLPLRIENLWGLTEGTTYGVWVGSYADSAWLDAGTVTVGADGFLSGDATLPLLSTVALVEL